MLQYAFRAVQISLCSAIALLIWNSVSPLARGVALAAFEPLDPAGEARPAPEFGDYQVIDARNLFKALEGDEAAPDVAEAPIEQSRLQVQLLGTVSADLPQLSVGIVKDVTRNMVSVVHVDENLPGLGAEQAKVVKIEQRRIVLEHDGRLEAIEVDTGAAKSQAARPAARPNDAASDDRVRARVERRMMNQLRRMNDPNSLADQAPPAVALERTEDGFVTGVQVQQLGPGSKLGEVGLQPGDRIVAVDGVRITDAVPLPQLMLSLGENTTKVFEVERNGSPTQIEVPAEKVLELIQELGAVP